MVKSCGKWSKIDIVKLPQFVLASSLFVDMFSINVAEFFVTLVGGVIYGRKLFVKIFSKKRWLSGFFCSLEN